MLDVIFRCSAIGKLIGEPKKKGEVLTDTAKTFIRQMAAEAIFGVDFSVSSREMQKGIQCEDQSIALYNSVFGKSLYKSAERRADEYLTGESDLPDVDEVADIKTAWSVATFPLSEDDVSDTQRKLYEWQLRGYMRLWGKKRGRVVYCLVDTPEDLCKWEDASLHMVGHIPEHMRVTTWTYDRDAELEALMIEKIGHARAYYAHVVSQFHETHQLCMGIGMPTMTPQAELDTGPADEAAKALAAAAVSFLPGDPPMGALADMHAADVAVQPVVDAEFREVGEPAPLAESDPRYIAPLVEAVEEPTLKLGDLNPSLGTGITMSEQFVCQTLGVQKADVPGRAVLFKPSQRNKILEALAEHCLKLRD